MISENQYMAQFVVRDLDDEAKTLLQRRAARYGRSMEEEAHDILHNALKNEGALPSLCATEGTGFKLEETSIANLEAAYLSGQTTAYAVTQAYLNRIATYDKRGPLINALVTINPHALEEADRLDAMLKATGKPVGPLHGIPVIVKDNIDVAGLPMTSVSGMEELLPARRCPGGEEDPCRGRHRAGEVVTLLVCHGRR
jgi:plasmid stability protein